MHFVSLLLEMINQQWFPINKSNAVFSYVVDVGMGIAGTELVLNSYKYIKS